MIWGGDEWAIFLWGTRKKHFALSAKNGSKPNRIFFKTIHILSRHSVNESSLVTSLSHWRFRHSCPCSAVRLQKSVWPDWAPSPSSKDLQPIHSPWCSALGSRLLKKQESVRQAFIGLALRVGCRTGGRGPSRYQIGAMVVPADDKRSCHPRC